MEWLSSSFLVQMIEYSICSLTVKDSEYVSAKLSLFLFAFEGYSAELLCIQKMKGKEHLNLGRKLVSTMN